MKPDILAQTRLSQAMEASDSAMDATATSSLTEFVLLYVVGECPGLSFCTRFSSQIKKAGKEKTWLDAVFVGFDAPASNCDPSRVTGTSLQWSEHKTPGWWEFVELFCFRMRKLHVRYTQLARPTDTGAESVVQKQAAELKRAPELTDELVREMVDPLRCSESMGAGG